MRTERPSLAARWTAGRRARLARTRPSTPGGNVEGERRLEADVRGRLPVAFGRSTAMAERTRAVDAEVARALGHGTRQVVLVGAGYDGRALRFGGAGTRWFEVDRPATQADKRRRLRALRIEPAGVAFVPLDLARHDLDAALDAAGHDPTAPSLFVCEGLLTSLTLQRAASVCEALRARASPDSTLVVALAVTPEGGAAWRVRRAVEDLVRHVAGEPRRSAFAPGDAEMLLAVTGWRVVHSAPAPPGPAAAARRPTGVVLVGAPRPGA